MNKNELINKVQSLLKPLEKQRYYFHPNTTISLIHWGEEMETTLIDIYVSSINGEVLLVSKDEFTSPEENNIDILKHFNINEVKNIFNILKQQLKS